MSIGHYRIGSRLGGGGMGVVYEAEDVRLLRKVALKFLPKEWSLDANAKQRFLREARLASAIDHPNICTVYEVDETPDGRLFIAMAYYGGSTLKERARAGPMAPESVRDIGIQTARGLAKAHACEIVHRDIKPANLMLTDDGVVKILDFGIAKIADSTLTSADQRLGTTPYMSPEQLRGESLDQRTDIWSLGVTLYEIGSGRRPFDSFYDVATMYSILNEDPEPLSVACPDMPDDLAEVIHRCLSKDRADRYQSANDLLNALGGIGDEVEAPDSNRASMAPLRETVVGAAARWRVVLPVALTLLVAALIAVSTRMVQSESASDVAMMDVAVLPLESVGADRELVDGFAYAVTSGLTSLRRLGANVTVVPYSEVIQDDVRTVSDAANAYGVSHVLAGRVQQTELGHVVSLDLVDTGTGRTADSRQLLVPHRSTLPFAGAINSLLADIFQTGIGEDALHKMSREHTNVEAAYDFYLRSQARLQALETDADLEIAIGLLQAAVQEDPGFAIAYASLGRAYLLQYSNTGSRSDMDKALEAAERASEIRPDLLETRMTLGEVLMNTGQLAEAETQLKEAMYIDSTSARTRHSLAEVFRQQGRIEEAEQMYIAATKLEPKNWQYHNALGKFYHALGHHEKAMRPFAEVISLRPTNAWGYNNLGAQYHRLGRLDEAARWYERAREVNPEASDAVAHATRNAAGIYYTQRDFERAAQLYAEAVTLDERSLEGWENLGNAYHWSGKKDDAKGAWRRVLDLARERLSVNPLDGHALEYMAETCAKLGDVAGAREAVDRLLGMAQVEMSGLINVVKTFEIMGERDVALSYAERAINEGASPSAFEASVWLDDLRQDPAYARILLAKPEG